MNYLGKVLFLAILSFAFVVVSVPLPRMVQGLTVGAAWADEDEGKDDDKDKDGDKDKDKDGDKDKDKDTGVSEELGGITEELAPDTGEVESDKDKDKDKETDKDKDKDEGESDDKDKDREKTSEGDLIYHD